MIQDNSVDLGVPDLNVKPLLQFGSVEVSGQIRWHDRVTGKKRFELWCFVKCPG